MRRHPEPVAGAIAVEIVVMSISGSSDHMAADVDAVGGRHRASFVA
jgi:hypothetical protein